MVVVLGLASCTRWFCVVSRFPTNWGVDDTCCISLATVMESLSFDAACWASDVTSPACAVSAWTEVKDGDPGLDTLVTTLVAFTTLRTVCFCSAESALDTTPWKLVALPNAAEMAPLCRMTFFTPSRPRLWACVLLINVSVLLWAKEVTIALGKPDAVTIVLDTHFGRPAAREEVVGFFTSWVVLVFRAEWVMGLLLMVPAVDTPVRPRTAPTVLGEVADFAGLARGARMVVGNAAWLRVLVLGVEARVEAVRSSTMMFSLLDSTDGAVMDLFRVCELSLLCLKIEKVYVLFNDALNRFLINGYIGVGNILIGKISSGYLTGIDLRLTVWRPKIAKKLNVFA